MKGGVRMKKVVIFGGNGFLGQEVIKKSLAKGYFVTSISRSGAPDIEAAWTTQVNWVQGDAFKPETWNKYLVADVVINTLGILLPNKTQSYEKMNVQAAQIIAQEVAQHPHIQLIHISAKHFTKHLIKGYFDSKKRGEQAVLKAVPTATIIRPNFMYGPSRKGTTLEANLINTWRKIPLVYQPIKGLQPQRVEDVAMEIVDSIGKDF